MLVCPFFTGTLWGEIIFDFLLFLILFLSLIAVSKNGHINKAVSVLFVLSVSTAWWQYFNGGEIAIVSHLAASFLLFAIVFFSILFHIFTHKKIDADLICASVCGYVFIAIAWSYTFLLLEIYLPGSINFGGAAWSSTHEGNLLHYKCLFQNFFYFSLTTLTTVGYGDIFPVLGQARMFAAMEAVIGQVYLTVIVARIVGLHISKSMMEKKHPGPGSARRDDT